jgi:hypothetical protein
MLTSPSRPASLAIDSACSGGYSNDTFIKGVGQVKDYTEVSLRLGASVIDRTRCFDSVVEHFRQLRAAVDSFNQANLTIASCSNDYTAFESYYGTHSASVPNSMRHVLDRMLAELYSSP